MEEYYNSLSWKDLKTKWIERQHAYVIVALSYLNPFKAARYTAYIYDVLDKEDKNSFTRLLRRYERNSHLLEQARKMYGKKEGKHV